MQLLPFSLNNFQADPFSVFSIPTLSRAIVLVTRTFPPALIISPLLSLSPTENLKSHWTSATKLFKALPTYACSSVPQPYHMF